MSTESDTDPDNNARTMSPSPRDVLSDPAFARAAAAAAAAGGPTSAALFHTLSGRVQHLMSRVGGGSSLNAMNGRLQQYMQGLQVRYRNARKRDLFYSLFYHLVTRY